MAGQTEEDDRSPPGLTSDSTSRISSPADGSSFQPTTSTAAPGPASITVQLFSSNRKRTLAQHLPATRTQPRLSVPRWTMAVVTGLGGRRQSMRVHQNRTFQCEEDLPPPSVRPAFNDQPLNGAAGLRLQLQNLCQRHRSLGQSREILPLPTETSSCRANQSHVGVASGRHLQSGDVDGLNVSSQLLADHAMSQQFPLHPSRVRLRPVALVHRHDDGHCRTTRENRVRTGRTLLLKPRLPDEEPLAVFACWMDSMVWVMTPSSAATTRMTMSVAWAPRALMEEKAAWPGVSRKVIFSPVGSWTETGQNQERHRPEPANQQLRLPKDPF